jgi:hypothetical protein
MPATLRSPLATGVALIGAGAIALTPISAPAPAAHVPAIQSAAVQLSSFQDPIALWVDVLVAAGGNVGGLAGQWLQDPAPMLTQIIANQIHSLGVLANAGNSLATGLANAFDPANDYSVPAILQRAAGQIAAGQFEDGFLTALQTVVFLGMPIMMGAAQAWPAISQPFKNLANLVDGSLFPLLMGFGLGMIAPLEPTLHMAGRLLEDAVSSAKAMDLVTLASIVINAPAALTGAFLNGVDIEAVEGFGYHIPGLLTPPGGSGSPGALSGILGTFSQLADLIKTPGTDRHDLGGALANLIGGIFGGAQANRSAVQKMAEDQVLADGPAAVAALPSATPKTITVNLTTDTGVKAVVAKAPAEKVVTETDSQTTVSDVVAEKESTVTVKDTAVKDTIKEAVVNDTVTDADTTEKATEKADTVVRISPKATPGKIGTTRAATELKQTADSVGEKANSTVSKIRDGLKKGFAKPSKNGADSASTKTGAGNNSE